MKYIILKGIANDKTKERYIPGDVVSLKGWLKKDIKHLINKGAIDPLKDKDDG